MSAIPEPVVQTVTSTVLPLNDPNHAYAMAATRDSDRSMVTYSAALRCTLAGALGVPDIVDHSNQC